jgi:hypothetical protein
MRLSLTLALVLVLATPLCADNFTNGPKGIRATGFKLPNGSQVNGAGVGIGMMEAGRPGDRDVDHNVDHYHDDVNPLRVFEQRDQIEAPGGLGTYIELENGHATSVASIMIGTAQESPPGLDARIIGVAPAASLSAAAYIFSQNAIDTLHNLVTLANPRTWVINHSYGVVSIGTVPDGNFPLTQYLDWSATQYDILHVVAGNQVRPTPQQFPKDQFNGITVIASTRQTVNGQYLQTALFNEFANGIDADGPRVSAGIMAPGEGILAALPGNQEEPNFGGTSGAAPHVTGTVALLHQYGQYKINNQASAFWKAGTARRHEVMKAVLLNSADKTENVHGSTRTIISNTGYRWEHSLANTRADLPLDLRLGAGHLNVQNAFRQYRSGEWDVGEIGSLQNIYPELDKAAARIVPSIGWDYGLSRNAFDDETGLDYSVDSVYVINRTLQAGEVIAATVCWDRRVELISPIPNDYTQGFVEYDNVDEIFKDLDLFIYPAGADPKGPNWVDASTSAVDNVEHVFYEVEETGMYQIVVCNSGGLQDDNWFGVAWWAGENLGGDFNFDSNVDGADLNDWRSNFGVNSESDADNDGDSDGADFLAWQRRLGNRYGCARTIRCMARLAWLGSSAVAAAGRRDCRADRRCDDPIRDFSGNDATSL